MKRGFALASALVILLVNSACAASSSPASAPAGSGSSPAAPAASQAAGQAGGQVTIGSTVEPPHLNALNVLPHNFPAHAPYTMIYDSLIQIGADGAIKPRLADKWEAGPDNKSMTFTLNSKAKFHDGKPVTAEDVAFTFAKIMDPDLNTTKDGGESVAGVEVVNPQTVKFNLKKVDPLFLPKAGSRGIVPKHLLDGKDIAKDEFNRKPVGSGPFKFGSWQSGSAVILDANPDYHLGAPKLGRVVFKIVPDQNAVVAQLRSGELDYGLVDPRDGKTAEAIATHKVYESPSPRFYSFGFNLRLPIFQDRAVREALMLATPRKDLVEQVLQGRGNIIHANTSPSSWAYNPEVTQHPYDPDKAKQLLAQAGWQPGSDGVLAKDGNRLAFAVSYVVTDKQTEQALTILQQRYKALGVAITLNGLEANDLLGNRWPKGQFEVSYQLWNPVYDPDQNSSLRTGAGYNGYGYANPAVDKLFDEALSTFDQAARKRAYGEIQKILATDLPALWLYSNNEISVVSKKIAGFQPHPINHFWNIQDWMVQ